MRADQMRQEWEDTRGDTSEGEEAKQSASWSVDRVRQFSLEDCELRKEGRSGEFDELLDTWHIYRPFPIPLLCLAVHASITGRPSPRDRPRHRTRQDLPL